LNLIPYTVTITKKQWTTSKKIKSRRKNEVEITEKEDFFFEKEGISTGVGSGVKVNS